MAQTTLVMTSTDSRADRQDGDIRHFYVEVKPGQTEYEVALQVITDMRHVNSDRVTIVVYDVGDGGQYTFDREDYPGYGAHSIHGFTLTHSIPLH